MKINFYLYPLKQIILSLIFMLTFVVMPASAEQDHAVQLNSVTITGDAEERARSPGSVHKIDKEELDKWQYTDVNRVLEDAPGVYVRREDGYGLRPNIGMRGADSDRSKKIALMEDGILFAPAPYAAPAAYYFPMMSRIQAVEIFKGPSSIKYGPNTVGGAINFVSRDIPMGSEANDNGAINFAVGSFGLAKAHGFYGDSSERFGWLIEGVHMQADGFKELDGGGDTGFEKNDVMLKLRFNSDPSAAVYHQLDVKLGYADETSDETYLGLTDSDFSSQPLRRYVASQRDEMVWDHYQVSLNYFFDPSDDYTINTTVYRNELSRVWDKLNSFAGNAPTLDEILRDPDSAVNIGFYEVLTGQANSTIPNETLLMGANARDIFSHGVQSVLDWQTQIGGRQHAFSFGARYHEDGIKRNHTENGFLMQSGDMVSDGFATRTTTKNDVKAKALSFYVQNEVTFDRLTLNGGVRVELITTDHHNQLINATVSRDDNVIIPGLGFSYETSEHLRVIGGVHKGFVPVAPGSEPDVAPEESINYELGLRHTSVTWQAEAIAFFSDYSNLSGSCTFSSGCAESSLDLGFNAGEVDIWGLETEAMRTFTGIFNSRLTMPVRFNYTFTQSEFKNSFTSPRPDLSDVRAGDELPNIPEHQFTIRVGLADKRWQAALAFNYVAEMRTVAGTGTPDTLDRTDTQKVFDFTSSYLITTRGLVYFTIDNIFDDTVIVSRRPFGARPGKPRSLMLGYKQEF